MIYKNKKRLERKNQIKAIITHPYFGFVLIGFALLLIQLLYNGGFVGITVARAFGTTMIYSIVALGFSILLGYSGLASLGTAGFIGLGTYIFGYMVNKLNMPFVVIIIAAIVIAIVLGIIVGFISLRIEGMYLAIITLGLAEILNEVFKRATYFTNGTNGLELMKISIFGVKISTEMVYIFIIFMLFITTILTLNIIKSPTGRAMLAMKNSDSAAQAMGVSILKYRLLAFILSSVYAVFGGTLYMAYHEFSYHTTWTLALSLNILAAVIVGGSRSIYGVILGTFMIFGLNQAVFQQIDFFIKYPDIPYILNGILIIIVVMFYPGGLVRLVGSISTYLRRLYYKLKKNWKEYRYGEDN